MRDKAPNHEEALATLRQTHKRLSEFVALLGVAPPESQAALSNVLLNRLDRPTLQPAQQQEGEQPLVPGLPASALRGRSGAHTQPPAERPPPGHFEWAVTQLALEPEQVGAAGRCCVSTLCLWGVCLHGHMRACARTWVNTASCAAGVGYA